VTALQYRDAIERLGLTQVDAARFLRVDPRTSRRYALGEGSIPTPLAMLLRLMLKLKLSPEEVSKMVWGER
jgi:hypothetical protein